jgi:RNA polymerase sigma-70 factor (ECF subfamily)
MSAVTPSPGRPAGDGAPEPAGIEGDALARLFDDYHQRLFRLARRLSSNHDEARDLVQETFVRVLQSPTTVPQDAHGRESWLITAMVNLARDRGRRRAVRLRVASATRDALADDRASPERGYLARIAVQDALGRLDVRRRAVVVLHYLEGAPVARVSELLRISPITVRWHLARARRELAALLSE